MARVYSQYTIRWVKNTLPIHPRSGVTIAYYRYIPLHFRILQAPSDLPRSPGRICLMMARVSSYNCYAFRLALILDLAPTISRRHMA